MFHFAKQIILVLVAFIGVFGFSTAVHASGGGAWQVIENPDFSSSTNHTVPLVINSNDIPYFAYQDGSNGNKATVMKYNGTDWLTVGNAGFSPDEATGLSLALDDEDTPYVAFANVASSSRAMVMNFDGANWVTVGNADFSGAGIADIQIVFSPGGIPYVTFADADHHITVMKLHDATWEAVGDPYDAVLGAVPVLAFNSLGTPYVAFSDIGTGAPTIIKFDGANWSLVGTAIASVNLATNVSFAISKTNELYVGTTDINDYLLRTFTFNGDAWVQIGTTGTVVTSGDTVFGFSPNGTLYIALEDTNNNAIVMKYNGTDWENVGEPQFSTRAVTMMSLAFLSNGIPYVAYSDWAQNHVIVMGFLPTYPGQVTGLSPSTVSPSTIGLSWNAPTDNGGAGITGYKIERESPNGSGFAEITRVSSAATTYTDTGLTPATSYNYRVLAINRIGVGSPSAPTEVTTSNVNGTGFVPVAPTAIAPSGFPGGAPLSFTVNLDKHITTNRTITALLNANSQTVRGYVISLDPTFAHDGIFPYTADTHSASFTLPNIPGTYTVYFKYYSTTGVYSPLFSQTITYQAPESINTSLFKRTLKIGSQGADVKALQEFLNSHGFPVAISGAGSKGHETFLFGKQTARALTQFQEANAAPILTPLGLKKGTGILGAATLQVIMKKSS